ncbi:MAG: glutamyl-tRNA reductase [Terriglobales bacterium]
MEPTLMVVGLNYRTAPMAVRERFWIDETRRYEALLQLYRAEGIDEVIVLSTCNRTEFWLWVNDVTLAANSAMRLLGAEYALKLCEWKHFYRLLDEAALLHIFRVASCLDSMIIGAPQIVPQVKDAWQKAQKVGASGRFLDAVLQKALTISERVQDETAIGKSPASIPSAAVDLAFEIFGTLENKKILLVGAGEMSELAARSLRDHGGKSVQVGVSNRTFENAAELAAKLGGVAIPFEERWQHMAEADIIITSTSCPHTIVSREEVESMLSERKLRRNGQALERQPLVIVDLAMPRDVDASVREIEGVFLYNLDDLENVSSPGVEERESAATEANKILNHEAQGFRRKLTADSVVPPVVALRTRLDEFCQQELEALRQENGPLSKDLDTILNAVLSRMTQRIAGTLVSELKDPHGKKVDLDQLNMALHQVLPSCNAPNGACQHQVGAKSSASRAG